MYTFVHVFEVVYNADDIVRTPGVAVSASPGVASARTKSAVLPGPDADIATLRRYLAEHFPTAAASPAKTVPCGIPAIDECLGGGIPLQALTEITCKAPSTGGQLVLEGLLESLRKDCRYAALVDGSDSFDPCGTAPCLIEHLLWIRCKEARQALKAVDVLLRDENFPLVILDLRWNGRQQFRRIPATTWYRLQRLCHGGSSLVLFSQETLALSARLRIELAHSLSLESLDLPRFQVVSKIHASIQRGQHLERAISA